MNEGTYVAWDFGDGKFSIENNPEHTYTKAGIYTITFIGNNTTVYDSKQLIKEYTITVVN